mmetsp:Transcript_12481/g.37037  ORF Transcript_12481/g.37037 Transcript_12481/m.37037 type:complete len:248 (+) Transcript_12481:236-979(+)
MPASKRLRASVETNSRYAFTSRMPRTSVTGPWPGTTSSGSSCSMASQALIQLLVGPCHTIGVPPMKRRSPEYRTSACGTQHTRSPRVCAGPSSKSSTLVSASRWPPTYIVLWPWKVLVAGVRLTSAQSKGLKQDWKNFTAALASSAGIVLMPSKSCGKSGGISASSAAVAAVCTISRSTPRRRASSTTTWFPKTWSACTCVFTSERIGAADVAGSKPCRRRRVRLRSKKVSTIREPPLSPTTSPLLE